MIVMTVAVHVIGIVVAVVTVVIVRVCIAVVVVLAGHALGARRRSCRGIVASRTRLARLGWVYVVVFARGTVRA